MLLLLRGSLESHIPRLCSQNNTFTNFLALKWCKPEYIFQCLDTFKWHMLSILASVNHEQHHMFHSPWFHNLGFRQQIWTEVDKSDICNDVFLKSTRHWSDSICLCKSHWATWAQTWCFMDETNQKKTRLSIDTRKRRSQSLDGAFSF